MKYSTAISMALAPVALAKSVRNRHPEVKREPNSGFAVGGVGGVGGINVGVGAVGAVAVAPIVLLWTNSGGGAQPNIINSQVTVTQTVTVAAGSAPTAIAGVDGVTTTVQPGATGVVAGTGATHSITVGGPQGLSFFPQELNAAVGDTLIFNFMAQNHTVTQSTFDLPCDPLAGGMDSGFMANPDNTIDPAPQVAMQVMTGEPLWMFCAQGNHCGQGMVFSINPTLEKTHAQFQSSAISQRGQNPGTAITGGAPAANDPAAAPPVNDPAAAPPVNVAPEMADPNVVDPLNSAVNDPLQVAPTIANDPFTPAATGSVATGALNGGIVMGVGSLNPDGSCNCAVQCDLSSGAGALQADQGAGGFGGVAGAIPMNAAAVGANSVGAANVAPPISVASVDPAAAPEPVVARR